jgi:chromosome partitioning protein
MLVQTSQGQSGSAHVVVLGNEKGGSGKSTAALHVAVALLKAGQRVATIDLDCRQQSFTRYINNRSAWARRTGLDLELPVHRCVKLGETMQILDNESSELVQFVDAVSTVERAFDFIVIDTPGSDTYLMRLAHAMADTLVTPINDSFLDFDVLGTVDPATYSVTGESHYAPKWCGTRGANAASLTAPAPTGSWCATGCRCLNHATSSSLSTVSMNCRSGSASARSMVLPSARSIANFIRVA